MRKIFFALMVVVAGLAVSEISHARLNCVSGESLMGNSVLQSNGSCSSGYSLSPYEGNVKCISTSSTGLAKLRQDLSDPPSYGYSVAFCFTMTGSDVVLGDINRITGCTSRVGFMCGGNRMARLNPVFSGSEWCTIDCD